MKTHFIVIICMLFSLLTKAEGLSVAGQYTLTNPCMPVVNITPVAGTYNCFSFTASNGIVNDPDSYYTWDFGNNTSATGKTVYHCYPPVMAPSVATATLTYSSVALCGVTLNVQTFTVALNTPTTGLCYSANPSLTVNDHSVTITIFPGIPEIMYNYHYGDGYWSNTDNTHVYGNCGNYIVTVKNWDMNAPQDTCYGYAAVNIPCDVAAGITETNGRPVHVFPNPCSDELFIETNEVIDYICVYDALGKELIRENVNSMNRSAVDITSFDTGIYQLKIVYRNGKQQHGKFIKE